MEKQDLIQKAIDVMEQAYTPYSNFNVGCSLLMKNGNVVCGANIENASYGLTNCAERSALFAAYSLGYRKDDIVSMVIVGDTEKFISPCGACRQVISELVSGDTEIILTNLKNDIKIVNKYDLLPFGFTDKDMEK